MASAFIQMRKIKAAFFICITTMASVLTLTGCSKTEVLSVKKDYISTLKDGVYYVRQAETNKCEPIYFGNGTFEEGTIKSSPENSRILWYKDDFDKIPTLYKGDSLILYTSKDFDEKITFERFEDLGYTIGICGMTELKSGRYSISTDVNKKCTYPGGDTDEILKLTTKNVTLDTLGDKDIRSSQGNTSNTFLSRCGTLLGLKKDGIYKTTIYSGTEEHEYTFTANIKALGSMEVEESYEYIFESGRLMNITIPSDFNTGYYLVNGIGVFRYVDGTSYDDNTNFNIPNSSETKINNSDAPSAVEDNTYATSSNTSTGNISEATKTASDKKSKFKVTKAGQITVKAQFSTSGNTSNNSITGISAIIVTPKGANLAMYADSKQRVLYRTFVAQEGEYEIIYYDLGVKEPHITVTAD